MLAILRFMFNDLIIMSQTIGFSDSSSFIIAIITFIIFMVPFCLAVCSAGILRLWGDKETSSQFIKGSISLIIGFPILYFLSIIIFIVWPYMIALACIALFISAIAAIS